MFGSQPGRFAGVAFALMFAPLQFVASQGSFEGESANALPRFDVASVKPTGRGFKALGVHRSPDRVEYANLTLRSILADAFSVRWDQIEGPAWLESDADSFTDPADKYLIEAKFPAGTPARTTRLMAQRLLMERFGLKYHRLRKDIKGHALVLDQGGAKFQLETRPPEKWTSSTVGRGLLTGPKTMSDLAMDLKRSCQSPSPTRPDCKAFSISNSLGYRRSAAGSGRSIYFHRRQRTIRTSSGCEVDDADRDCNRLAEPGPNGELNDLLMRIIKDVRMRLRSCLIRAFDRTQDKHSYPTTPFEIAMLSPHRFNHASAASQTATVSPGFSERASRSCAESTFRPCSPR